MLGKQRRLCGSSSGAYCQEDDRSLLSIKLEHPITNNSNSSKRRHTTEASIGDACSQQLVFIGSHGTRIVKGFSPWGLTLRTVATELLSSDYYRCYPTTCLAARSSRYVCCTNHQKR